MKVICWPLGLRSHLRWPAGGVRPPDRSQGGIVGRNPAQFPSERDLSQAEAPREMLAWLVEESGQRRGFEGSETHSDGVAPPEQVCALFQPKALKWREVESVKQLAPAPESLADTVTSQSERYLHASMTIQRAHNSGIVSQSVEPAFAKRLQGAKHSRRALNPAIIQNFRLAAVLRQEG